MKAQTTLFPLRALAAYAAALMAQQTHGQNVLYNNATNYSGNFNFASGGPAPVSAGNEVDLPAGSSGGFIDQTVFQFDLVNSGASPLAGRPTGTEVVDLSFYQNNGAMFNGNRTPGTLIWDSGASTMDALGLTNFTQSATLTYTPGVFVPPEFTWVVTFGNLPPDESAGLALCPGPVVPGDSQYAWVNTGNGWTFLKAAPGGVPALQFGAVFQGAVWPQPGAFQNIQAQTNGTVQIGLIGMIGGSYTLNASTNLVSWSPLATFTNLTGSVQFSDFSASNFPARFYRITANPPIGGPQSYSATLGTSFSPVPATVNIYVPAQAEPVPPNLNYPFP